MIVKSLSHQHLGQFTFGAGALLDLGTFVLEPDLDLVFIQTQFGGQTFSPLFRQIPIVVEFAFQPEEVISF